MVNTQLKFFHVVVWGVSAICIAREKPFVDACATALLRVVTITSLWKAASTRGAEEQCPDTRRGIIAFDRSIFLRAVIRSALVKSSLPAITSEVKPLRIALMSSH